MLYIFCQPYIHRPAFTTSGGWLPRVLIKSGLESQFWVSDTCLVMFCDVFILFPWVGLPARGAVGSLSPVSMVSSAGLPA